jgi:DNA-binding LytR/AlgR family response regulator
VPPAAVNRRAALRPAIGAHELCTLVRRTIQELEQDLAPRTFFRIHRSIIVNLERVRGLELRESGEYAVVLDSNILRSRTQ